MKQYFLISILSLLACFNATSQELKPYHIHNRNYEHFLTKDLINANFKKILKTPEKYQGKYINVKGYLVIDSSISVIYESEKDFQNYLKGLKVQRYKLLLSLNESSFLKDSCSNKNVSIQGTFSETVKDEVDGYNGTFSNICIIPI